MRNSYAAQVAPADGVREPTYRQILNNFGKLRPLRSFPHERARLRHAACAFVAGTSAMSRFGTTGAGDLDEKRSRSTPAAGAWSRSGTGRPARQAQPDHHQSPQGGFRCASYCDGCSGASDASPPPRRTRTGVGRVSVARPVAEQTRSGSIPVALSFAISARCRTRPAAWHRGYR
jgi:hypothetical protein